MGLMQVPACRTPLQALLSTVGPWQTPVCADQSTPWGNISDRAQHTQRGVLVDK